MSDPSRQRRLVELLTEALELDGEDRRQLLDRECAGDADLQRQLEAMLAAEEELDEDFLATPPSSPAVALAETLTAPPPPGREVPEQLGPFRVLEPLGEGSMGRVYLGEQHEPLLRRVAIKVLDGLRDEIRQLRFLGECRALARLSHPNIATLYETGETADGYLFVAMELVEGAPITEWCDQRRLSIRQRLELFRGVCAGVRHAHEKGLLHRDLKPSNILVAEIDGQPTAKVIDFGIASAIDEPLLVDVRVTVDNQLLGSPAFMSPEAASFGRQEVDTRSDVYSLGLVLYELLVGVLPFDSERESLAIILRRITEEDLPSPLKRLAGLDGAQAEALADRRRLSAKGLERRLRGDLDAIIRKASAREPDHRYSSPTELAADLERYLQRQPIEARPPSTSYLLQRFLRRRAGVVVSVALVILALTAGLVARSVEARRANQEAERARQALAEAQQLSTFLIELFDEANPERNPGAAAETRKILDKGVEKLRHGLDEQPLVRARFLQTIGSIYTNLALFQPASELLEEALEIRQDLLPAEHPEVLETVNQLGINYRRQKRLEEAEPLLRRVLTARRSTAVSQPLELAKALNNLGNLLWNQKRIAEAEQHYLEALAIRRRELPPGDPDLAISLNNLGALLQGQRKHEEARPFFEQAAEVFAEQFGDQNPSYGAALYNLGVIDRRLGRWQAAEELLEEALAVWTKAYGAGHPRSLDVRRQLSYLYRSTDRYEAQVGQLREVVRLLEAQAEPNELAIALALRRLGLGLGSTQDFAAASAAMERSVSIYRRLLGDQDLKTLAAISNTAWLAAVQGDHAQAEVLYRQVLEGQERALGDEHLSVGSTLHYLAKAVANQQDHRQAEVYYRRALAVREKLGTPPRIASTLGALGGLYLRSQRPAEAEPLLRRALEIRQTEVPADPSAIGQLEIRLAEALSALAP